MVRASGVRRFWLWAGHLGVPRAIDYAVHHPRSVKGLILYAAFARVADVFRPDAIQGFAHLARADWRLASQAFADMSPRREFPEAALREADIYRQSTTGESVARLLLQGIEADVTLLLPMVKVPTLVLHRLHDATFPVALGQQLAAAIPGARFVP